MHIRFQPLQRIVKAFGYSREGLKAAYASEAAFRQEVWLLVFGAPVAMLVTTSAVGHALMIGSLLLVLIVEIVNTAIETIIERISSQQHPLSKKAKDLGSAAVLLALLNAAVIWICVLLD